MHRRRPCAKVDPGAVRRISYARPFPAVYHPREPTDSPLWKILHNHYEDFKAGYDEHGEKQYGFFRPVVDEVVEEYLRCGDLHACKSRVLVKSSKHIHQVKLDKFHFSW
jgi:hypothetical protein